MQSAAPAILDGSDLVPLLRTALALATAFALGTLIGVEGPSLRKRTVRNENTGEILTVSSKKA